MLTNCGFRPGRLSWLKIVLVFLAIGFPASSFAAKHSSVTSSERWILRQVAAGQTANLKDNFKADADREISALFLQRLLTREMPGAKVRAYGVRISNAIVKGKLDLTNEEIPYYVALDDCVFDDDVVFVRAHFKSSLDLKRSVFYSPVDFTFSTIEKDLAAQGVQFLDEDLTTEITPNDNKIQDEEDQPKINLSNMKVGGPIFLDNAVFDRLLYLYRTEAAGNLEMDDVRFNKSANFELAEVRGHAFFKRSYFEGPTRFYGAKVTENFEAQEAHFDDTKSGVNFEGLSARHALFTKAVFNGPARFYGMNVTNFEADDSSFYHSSIVSFQNMVIKGHAYFFRTVFKSPATFLSTTVSQEFVAGSAQFNEVTFNLMKVDTVGFPEAHFNGPVYLSGMSYREVTSNGIENFREMLRKARYDAGAYAALEDYYRKRGIIGGADEVYIEQRQRERDNLWLPQRWLEALVLDFGVGYGRHPWRVLIWSGIVLLVGCYVFRQRRLMDPQKPEYGRRHYSRFLYSLDLFLPIVDLQSASIWIPKRRRRWARRYLPMHVIAGWILVTILVAALTGILK